MRNKWHLGTLCVKGIDMVMQSSLLLLVKRPLVAVFVMLSAFSLSSQSNAATFKFHRYGTEGVFVEITGKINWGDDIKFSKLVSPYRYGVVSLSSTGGSTFAAIEIGKLVRAKGLSTVVAGKRACASACALIWLGGLQRYKSNTAKVGFHASYTIGKNGARESGLGNALVGRYLTQLNLSENAVVFVTLAPPQRMNWLTRKNAASSNIQFSSVDIPNPIATAKTLRADPAFRALFNSWRRLDQLNQGLVAIPNQKPSAGLSILRNYSVGRDEFGGSNVPHAGIDLAGEYQSPVFATADGVVSAVGVHEGRSTIVAIDHGRGIQTRYGNLSSALIVLDARVKRGQLIGLMGHNEQSAAGFVHYEVRIDERAVDPNPFFQTNDELNKLQQQAQ
jgi:Peptidase family M23